MGRKNILNGVRYSTNRNIDTKQLDTLWGLIGWKPRGTKKWKEVLSKSSSVYSAWKGNLLIGFGRFVEDGIMCRFNDIGVHPDYQKQGIGTEITKFLISKVKNKKYESISLFRWKKNPGNMSFYEKFGFKKVDTGMELFKYMKDCELHAIRRRYKKT